MAAMKIFLLAWLDCYLNWLQSIREGECSYQSVSIYNFIIVNNIRTVMKIISGMSLFILVNDYLHQIIKFNFAIRQYYALLSC